MFKKQIPNAITSANLFFGCLGILSAVQGGLVFAASCIFIAAIFDFFDGFAARLLNVSGPMGKELDSLADVVSFGVLPAMILFKLAPTGSIVVNDIAIIPYLAFFIAVFSAYRLAKFNLDERQSDQFIGLPTPANAVLIASFALSDRLNIFGYFSDSINTAIYTLFILMMCLLLVAELPLMALKFKNWSFKDNSFRYIFITLSLVLLALLQITAIPLIIISYLIISIIILKTEKNKLI